MDHSGERWLQLVLVLDDWLGRIGHRASTNNQERIQISHPRRSGYDDPSSPRCTKKG